MSVCAERSVGFERPKIDRKPSVRSSILVSVNSQYLQVFAVVLVDRRCRLIHFETLTSWSAAYINCRVSRGWGRFTQLKPWAACIYVLPGNFPHQNFQNKEQDDKTNKGQQCYFWCSSSKDKMSFASEVATLPLSHFILTGAISLFYWHFGGNFFLTELIGWWHSRSDAENCD